MATRLPGLDLPSGDAIPPLGQGTWGMAENPAHRADELATLRLGLDLGLRLVATSESYADGAAEELVGEAVTGRRDEAFLVTTVRPEHATRAQTARACQQSLRRLRTDRIDLYLLHRRGPVPLAETVEAFMDLLTEGLIRHWGVGDFDVADLVELTGLPGGTAVEADRVRYDLTHRDAERDLLPRCRAAHLAVLAYPAAGRFRLPEHPVLRVVARRHRATPAQVAVAWVLRTGQVCAVSRATGPAGVHQQWAAQEITLGPDDLVDLDRAFPLDAPPSGNGC